MSARNILGLILLLLTACLAAPARAGDIYACKDTQGRMAYQDTPCPTTAKTASHVTYRPFAKPSPAPSSVTWDDDAQASPTRRHVAVPQSYGVSAPYIHTGSVEAVTCVGIGCTKHQSGQVHTMQCVAPDGRKYYTITTCATREQYVGTAPRDWHNDTVEHYPDAVMINRNEALDPRTGRVMELNSAPMSMSVYQSVRDPGQRINSDAACVAARQDAHMHPDDAKAAKRAHEICSAGRGLWDQAPPDRGVR